MRDRLDLLGAMRGWLDPERAVVPREEIFPPGQTQQQTDAKNTQDFVTSQNSAELAALAYLDKTKIVVTQVADDSPSHGKLAAKDTITAVQGTPVGDVTDLGKVLGATAPGTTVTVDYLRDGKPGSATDHHHEGHRTRTARPGPCSASACRWRAPRRTR